MSIFNSNKAAGSEPVPPQRVAGFANLDLNKCLAARPYTFNEAKDVDWDIEYGVDDLSGEDVVTARGNIEIPVAIRFKLGDVEDDSIIDDLVVSQIVVSGHRLVSDHLKKANIPFDPLATVDTVRAEGQARRQYRNALHA